MAHASMLLSLLPLAGGAYVGLTWLLGAFHHSPWQLPGVVLRIVWTLQRTLVLYIARGYNPLFPQWTLPFELVRALIHGLLRHYGDRIATRTTAPILRRQSELFGNAIAYFTNRTNQTMSESFQFNGLEHVWVRSAASSSHLQSPRYRVVVLYFHGGGHVVLSPRMYQGFASHLQTRLHRALAEKLGGASDRNLQVDVLLANYRKAPEYPYPRPPLDALAMYKYLLDHEELSPHQILVMGDSAGGGLALTTMLRLRDEEPALLPVAGVLSCPFVDRETKGDERVTPYCLLTDRATTAFHKAYFKDEAGPSSSSDSSPVHCDLRGLPPVYIQVGELDYILSHSKRLLQQAHACGLTNWTLEIFPNMPHDFPLLPPSVLPTAAKGIEVMAQYAAVQLAESLQKNDLADGRPEPRQNERIRGHAIRPRSAGA